MDFSADWFKDQREQSRQLTSHIISQSHAPIERSLEQIQEQTKRLMRRTVQDESADAKAAYLLANRGFDAETVREQVNEINLTFEPLSGVADTDIEGTYI
jgi:SOS response regulatory protein OraA/RecX